MISSSNFNYSGIIHLLPNRHHCYQHSQKRKDLELLNPSLRNRDKLKEDAISQLSDQLVALSTRLQEIERRQQLLTHH
jgi:hypothetical protein